MTDRKHNQSRMQTAVVVTCEHGGSRVPVEYRHLFRNAGRVLRSHRGWDPGALEVATHLATELKVRLFSSRVTRLLVELNRSQGHPQLFSEYTRMLDLGEKKEILTRYWHPYRDDVQQAISRQVESNRSVLHVSVHTFSAVWQGQPRRTDVGLLYDPERHREKRFCQSWQASLRAVTPQRIVHRNAPYRGTSDGLTTALRQTFSAASYSGIELEVNQRLLQSSARCRTMITTQLITTFLQTLSETDNA